MVLHNDGSYLPIPGHDDPTQYRASDGYDLPHHACPESHHGGRQALVQQEEGDHTQ